MIQATIWSDRRHCEAEVVAGLRALDCQHLWLVHGGEQAVRLANLAQGMAVEWVVLPGQPFPQIVRDPHGREAKQRACADAYNTLLHAMEGYSGASVLLVDDDIVLPANAVRLLAVSKAIPADAVSGLTRCANGALPVFWFADQHRMTDSEIPNGPILIDACGTFCMYLSEAVVTALPQYWAGTALKVGAGILKGHDLHFCHWLRSQGFWLALDPSVRCQHHVEVEPGRIDVLRI